jgi:rsbT co-antagonist protein RsbR
MEMATAKLLQKKRNQLLELWMKKQLADAGLREDLLSNEDLREQSEELVTVLIKYIGTSQTDDYDQVYEVLAGISMGRAKQGFSPRETGLYIFGLKDSILEIIQQELESDPKALYQAAMEINKLIDGFGIITFETFIKGREEVILRQTDEISEISTPVIRVWDGILALPIIGTLDSSRTQIVMENLLQEIVTTSSSIAILDISGVPTVDSLVAQHLIKTVSATRLMGAECIISGIRPEIAQTVVHLGIDLSNIITKASLASALRYAFSMLQLEVKKAQK